MVQVSGHTVLESVDFYTDDDLEMAGSSVVPLGRETTNSLLRSFSIEFFGSVELHWVK